MTLFEIVAKFEGCRLTAYKCPAGVWTIGYGNTSYIDGSPVKEGDKITQADADLMFKQTLENFRVQVTRIVPATLPSGAVDALTSFAYNCGTGALQRSTLLKKIKADALDLKGIKAEFAKWNKGAGKVLPGLVKRREAEYKMYEEAVLSMYSKYELLYMKPPSGK